MWSNYGEIDFILSQRPAQRAELLIARSVLAATLAAIRMRKDAALALSYSAVTQKTEQKCWAGLAGVYCLLPPANLPCHLGNLATNGGRQEDTIPSGIMSLASSSIAVAAVVFIASILVLLTKSHVMFTLLLSIHFKCEQDCGREFCCCVW